MNHYKDTTQQPNTLETLKTAQNDNRTKVSLLYMVKSILLAVLMIGLLLLISSYHQAHPKNNLLLVADMMDNRVLSNNHASGKPYRYSLAFFVLVIGIDSQSLSIHKGTAPHAHLSATRGQTIISIASHLLTDYDGLTLQNKIAERRICRAVSSKTESKTRHPISLLYSVALTQNLLGGYHA